MTAPKPATPLGRLVYAVEWEDQRVSLYTTGNDPYDFVIGTSKDSVKGKAMEEFARRANNYPKLVQALQELLASQDDPDGTLFEMAAARALLRSIGESS